MRTNEIKMSPTVVIPGTEPWIHTTPHTDSHLLELKRAGGGRAGLRT